MWLPDNKCGFVSLSPLRRMTFTALLVSMALVLSWLERLLPVQLVAPIPGIKLGLPNVITLFALVYTGRKNAFVVMLLRVLLAGMLFGSPVSLAFSLAGGMLAFAAMACLLPGRGRLFSDLGLSVIGAAAHNTGQVCAAALVMETVHVFVYLGVLLLSSLISGALIGLVFTLVNRPLSKILPELIGGPPQSGQRT